jgi:GTP-binding protein
MPLSVVAIVGRPNVGKSSIFNCLAGRRIAIVDPTAGVTRDRVSAIIERDGRWFELVDTGGMGIEDSDQLTAEVEEQITLAIDEAALIIFAVDVRDGVTPLDRHVADRLRRQGKPVILVANKADSEKIDTDATVFYELGLGEPLPLSAKAARHRPELLRRVLEALPEADESERPMRTDMTMAIVGKRNAGKSTFINTLAGEPRVIVSEIPGTTRDSVDIRIEKDALTYVVIDTAGLRKKASMKGDIEFYSRVRAEQAIRRADVSLLLIDATSPISMVEKHLARFIVDARKAVVIIVSKWDLAKGKTTSGNFADYIGRHLPGLDFAPVTFLSAMEGRNVWSALDVARSLFKQSHTRVSTSRINKAIASAVKRRKPPSGKHGGLVKIYYGTQVTANPPTIALFVNDPDNVSTDYARYLVHQFRETLPFTEIPLRLLFRRSGGEAKHPAVEAAALKAKGRKGRQARKRAAGGGKKEEHRPQRGRRPKRL